MENRLKYLVGAVVIVAGLVVLLTQRATIPTVEASDPPTHTDLDEVRFARITMPLWVPRDANFRVEWMLGAVGTDGKPSFRSYMRHKPTGARIEQTQTVDRFYGVGPPAELRRALQAGKRRWVLTQSRGASYAYLHLGRIRLSLYTSHPRGKQLLRLLCVHYSNIYSSYGRAVSKLSGLERSLVRSEYDVCEYPVQIK